MSLQTALFQYAEGKGELQSRREALEKLYANVKGANIDSELTADLVGDYLFTDADFIRNLSIDHQNVFRKIFDEIKYLWKVATAGSKEARELEKIKKTFEKIYREGGQTRKDTLQNNGTKYSITVLENGNVYVNASRNVVQGTTIDEMRKDIAKFFSALLEDNPSLELKTIEGDILTITKADTAHKARDDYKLENGKRVKMTDEEFAVKMHIESHIDEIAQVSTKIPGSERIDEKKHSFAKDGFTYRRAYFEDFDGQYYKVTLSIGNNGTVATVYNVGKIKKEDALPSARIIAGVGSKPLGKSPSDYSISQSDSNVNTQNFLSADEDIFPTRDYKIRGRDVALDEPLPMQENVSTSKEAAEGSETLYTQEERSKRLERKLQRIDRRLEREKADLKAEFENRRQTMEESSGDKNDFISNRASSLYEELRNLKKGVFVPSKQKPPPSGGGRCIHVGKTQISAKYLMVRTIWLV